MASRQRFCLESTRDRKEILDILLNDEDSDIEETDNNEIEELVHDFQEIINVQEQHDNNEERVEHVAEPINEWGSTQRTYQANSNEIEELVHDFQEQLDNNEEGVEHVSEAVHVRGNAQRREPRRRRGRGRSLLRSTSSRVSQTIRTAREIDETNGWSYRPLEQLPEDPVFQDLCMVLAPIDETSSEFDCFSVFFPEEFWKLLKTETNRYAAQMKAKQSRQGLLKPGRMLYSWKPVTIQEIKNFLAIIIHMTLVHKESFDSYWSTKEIVETPFAKKIMARSRFRAIYSCLHLNDNSKYIPRGHENYDAFFKLRPYFDQLSQLCEMAFYPDEALTIDEGTCGYRGRVHFRVYNKDKPDKYGMKVYMICDAKTGYILKMVPYVGDSKTVATIVTELSQPFFEKWHTIYMDRFFTSPNVADILWQNKTRVVGTVMGNRRGLPQEWRHQPLQTNEMTFCHRAHLTACKWKDKRDVLMLSTKHAATWSEVTSKSKGVGLIKRQKPDCIIDYNHHKIGVDLNDQYVSYYSLNRKTMKWWKKMFFHLVARALVNSYVIYNRSRTQKCTQRFSQFLMTCGEGLVQSAVPDAPGPSHGPHFVGMSTRLVGRHFIEKIPATEKKKVVSRVCKVCAETIKIQTGKRGRKETVYYCPDCNVPLCYYPCFKKFHTKKVYTV